MKKMSFHGHELISAEKAEEFLTLIGIEKEIINEVKLLIKEHQFRFYPDTHPSTIRKWMRKLGKDKNHIPRWKMLLSLAALDRAGAGDKKRLTPEWINLLNFCRAADIGLFYYEDLDYDHSLLKKIDLKYHAEALNNMINLVETDFRKNNKSYLHNYLTRNYIMKE